MRKKQHLRCNSHIIKKNCPGLETALGTRSEPHTIHSGFIQLVHKARLVFVFKKMSHTSDKTRGALPLKDRLANSFCIGLHKFWDRLCICHHSLTVNGTGRFSMTASEMRGLKASSCCNDIRQQEKSLMSTKRFMKNLEQFVSAASCLSKITTILYPPTLKQTKELRCKLYLTDLKHQS